VGNKARGLLNVGTVRADLVHLTEELKLLAPCAGLTEKQTTVLRAKLAPLLPVLVDARKIATFPHGYFSVDWASDPLVILLRHFDHCGTACWLLSLDASIRAQDGDWAGAWVACDAMLNAARALGDEPGVVQLGRVARHRAEALCTMERVLGQGTLPESVLAATQKTLKEEAGHPALLIYLRGRRASVHHSFLALESGTISLARFKEGGFGEPGFNQQVKAYFSRHEIKPAHAWVLIYWTRAVEIAKGPPAQQEQALAKLNEEMAYAPTLARPLLNVGDKSHLFKEGEANLHCATAALAVERYRLKHGRWPDTLSTLVLAQFLREVPVDPYDGQPLRYRPTKDGVVLYSIGPDGKGDGAALERNNFVRADLPLEFRLWNPDLRRQPQRRVSTE
jgi:hypothetical protein